MFTDADLMVMAALDGRGLAYAFDGQVAEHVASAWLIRVLEDWCPPYPGFFLSYPSRRQTPPALAALVEALRFRAGTETFIAASPEPQMIPLMSCDQVVLRFAMPSS